MSKHDEYLAYVKKVSALVNDQWAAEDMENMKHTHTDMEELFYSILLRKTKNQWDSSVRAHEKECEEFMEAAMEAAEESDDIITDDMEERDSQTPAENMNTMQYERLFGEDTETE